MENPNLDTLQANNSGENPTVEPRKPVFPGVNVPPAYWVEDEYTILGTAKNARFQAAWSNDPQLKVFGDLIDRSFAVKEDHTRKVEDIYRTRPEFTRKYNEPGKILAGEPPMVRTELPEDVMPKINPYAAWFVSKGKNRGEVISALARDSEHASYIVKQMEEKGVFTLLENNKSSIGSPKELAELLSNPANGFLNQQDVEFFLKDAEGPYSKYSRYWGTSPYQLLLSKVNNKNWGSVNHPSTLPQQISMGRRLNPNDENDVRDLENYQAWRRTSDSTDWAENFLQAGKAFVTDVATSLSRSVEAVGYPEFRFSAEWSGDSLPPEKRQMKERFIAKFNEWRERFEKGELEESSLDKKIQQFEQLKQANPQLDPFEIVDPSKNTEVSSKLLNELVALHTDLQKQGAFDYDVRGLTSFLSLLDGAIQGTLGMSMLLFSTDPDSFVTGVVTDSVARYYEMKEALGGKDEEFSAIGAGYSFAQLLTGHEPSVIGMNNIPKKGLDTKKLRTKAMMRYINVSADAQGMFEAWQKEGFVAGEANLYDSKIGYHTSNWADIDLLEAVGKKILTLGQRAYGKTSMGAAFAERRLAESRKIAVEQAELLAKRYDSLPPTFAKVVDDVVAQVEAQTGNKLPKTDARADAIRRIYGGEPLMPDPKDPTKKIAYPVSMLDAFTKDVADHATGMASVRRKMAELVVEGRKITYSKDAYDSLAKLREHLHALEPQAAWDKATDFAIYQRLKMGSLGELPAELESRRKKLMTEVGNNWKKFDKKDLAAWERFDANELSVGITAPGQGIMFSAGWIANKLNRGVDWLEDRIGSMRKETRTIPGGSDVRTVIRVGNETVPGAAMNHVQTNNLYNKISFSQQMFAMLHAVGYLDYAAELYNDWTNTYRRLGTETAESFSTWKNMIDNYTTELNELYAQQKRDALLTGTAKTKKEADALGKKIERLEAKKKMAHLMGSVSSYGVLSGMAHIGSGVWSAGSNELLMYLSDTRMLGSATAYSTGGKGLNMLNKTWMRNMDPTYGVKERANMDLVEIAGKMADLNDAQRMHILEALVGLAKNRDEALAMPGQLLVPGWSDQAHLNYARGVSIINRLFSSADEFEFQTGTYIDGMGEILSANELASNPMAQDVLLKVYGKEAQDKGLKGEEASEYAKRMLERHTQNGVVASRLSVISKGKSSLLAERQKLGTQYTGILTEIEEKARAIALESGLDIGVAGDLMQNNRVLQNVKIKGIPLTLYAPDVAQKYIKAINIFNESTKEIIGRKMDIERSINEINSNLIKFDEEAKTITAKQSNSTFVAGDFVVSDKAGNIVSRRGAITVWETPYRDEQGQLRTRTKIVINKDTFLQKADFRNQQQGGIQRAYEEISHALLFTERFHDHRVMFTRALFGEWQINEHGEFIQTGKPFITGDLEKNLQLLDMFTEAYAQGLPENQRDAYLARYRFGREMMKKNPADWHYMRDSITELYGQVYVQRQMLSHPQAVKTGFTGSTYQAGWETSPIIAGSPKWKIGMKMLFGQVTPADIFIHMRGEENLRGLFEIDPETSDPSQRKILESFAEDLKNTQLFLDFFGMGGISDQLMQTGFVKKALDLGLRKNNNDSPDPMKFWKYGMIWDDVSGRMVPLDKNMAIAVDVAQAATRGVTSKTSLNDPYNIGLIEAEQNSDAPEAIQRRVFWAYATGRQSWLKVGNKFKDSVKKLFIMENESLEEFKNYVIEQDPDGTITGLDVVTNSDGSKSIFGSPSRSQTIRILNWLKKANEKAGTYSADPKNRVFSQNTLSTIASFLEGIAQSNIFDNENITAGTAGKLPIYLVSYQGVTTGEGPGTTSQKSLLYFDREQGVNIPAGPRQRRIAPWAFTIEPTQIDGDGNVLEKTDEFGRPVPGERGSMNAPYFWVIDIDAFDERMRAGWEGKLVDKNGETYPITSQEFRAMFDNDYNTYAKALSAVMKNFSMHAGSPQKGSKQYGIPPQRTWQALLPFVTDKAGNKNVAKAMMMADLMLRVIGFPDDQYSEFKALEVKQERQRLSAAERIRYKELQDKLMNASFDEKKRIFAQIGAKHRNELGAGPMWDTRMIFMKIRAERIIGTPMALQDKSGRVSMIPFTPWSYPWGKANYAGLNDWSLIPDRDVEAFTQQFNMQDQTIRAAYTHPSRYNMFLVDNSSTANPAGTRKWVVFDTQGNVIPGEFTTAKDAATGAENHSKANPQTGLAEVGNDWELQMQKNGWNPVGTAFGVHRFRTEWMSPDAKWKIVGNSAVGNWQLYDVKTGYMVSSGFKLRTKDDPKNLDIAELNAQIQHAIDTNKVQQIITQERHKILTQRGIIEWVKETNPFSGEKKQRVFADDNRVYWAFKSQLVNVFGAAMAEAITTKMKEELTPAVIESDPKATIAWIRKYRDEAVSKGLFGFLFNSPDPTISQERAHNLARRPIFDRARDKQPALKPEDMPAYNPAIHTVESYRLLQQKWHEMNEEWLKSTAFTDSEENRQLQEQAHQANVDNFNNWVNSLKDDMQGFVNRNTVGEPTGSGLPAMGERVISQMNQNIDALRQAGYVVETTSYTNDFGNVIVELTYKSEADIYGRKVSFPSIIGGMTGRKMRGSEFYIYSPTGTLLGREDTLERAQVKALDSLEQVLKYKVDTIRKAAEEAEKEDQAKRVSQREAIRDAGGVKWGAAPSRASGLSRYTRQ